MDLNSVNLIGRLTRDAELKTLASGYAVSKFSIAVNYRKRNGQQWDTEANFFDVSLFGKTAESLNQYLRKGKQIAVSGQLRQERWQQDGFNKSRVGIIADSVQLLDTRQEKPQQEKPQQQAPDYTYDDFIDDIPF